MAEHRETLIIEDKASAALARVAAAAGQTSAAVDGVAAAADRAAPALDRVNPPAAGAGEAAEKAANGVDAFRAAAGKAKVSAGQMGAAASNLRSQLVDVTVGLLTGQKPMSVFIQQGPQIGEAMAAGGGGVDVLVKALGPLATFAGPILAVGAAVGALALAFKVSSAEGERAAAIAKITGDAHRATLPILNETALMMERLSVLSGEMTEKQAAFAAANRDAFESYKKASAELGSTLAALREEQGSVGTQIADGVRASLEMFGEITGIEDGTLEVFDALIDSSATLTPQIKAAEAAQRKQIEATRKNAEAGRALVEAEDRKRKATDAATAAHRRQADELDAMTRRADAARAEVERLLTSVGKIGTMSEDDLRALADALYEAGNAAEAGSVRADNLAAALEQVVTQIASVEGARLAAVGAWAADSVSEIGRLTLATEEAAAALGDIRSPGPLRTTLDIIAAGSSPGGAVGALGGKLMEAGTARSIATGGAAGGAMAGVGAGLSAAAGVAGGAVAAVQVVAGLDEMEKGIRSTAKAAVDNLKHLDTLLPGIADALGDAIAAILANLPEILWSLAVGIVKAIFSLNKAIIKGLVELGRKIVDAILPGDQSGKGRNNGGSGNLDNNSETISTTGTKASDDKQSGADSSAGETIDAPNTSTIDMNRVKAPQRMGGSLTVSPSLAAYLPAAAALSPMAGTNSPASTAVSAALRPMPSPAGAPRRPAKTSPEPSAERAPVLNVTVNAPTLAGADRATTAAIARETARAGYVGLSAHRPGKRTR